MNGRSSTGRLRLYSAGFVNTEDEHAFSYFYSFVIKYFRNSPKFAATYMATGLINAVNKCTQQTKVVLDDYHLNRNQQVNVWSHVCRAGRSGEFDNMNNDIYKLRQCKTWDRYYEIFKKICATCFNGVEIVGSSGMVYIAVLHLQRRNYLLWKSRKQREYVRYAWNGIC